jgi:hypothetical protein
LLVEGAWRATDATAVAVALLLLLPLFLDPATAVTGASRIDSALVCHRLYCYLNCRCLKKCKTGRRSIFAALACYSLVFFVIML